MACASGALLGAGVAALTGAGVPIAAVLGCITDVLIEVVTNEIDPNLGRTIGIVDVAIDILRVILQVA